MKVTIEKPEVIVMVYRQEKTDPDYGSCMWARFYLDMVNYTINIESDCGTYGYKWLPTPNSESFLALLCRMDKEYLLDKIASRTVIDGDTTWKNVKELVENAASDQFVKLSEIEMKFIKLACYENNTIRDVVEAVKDAIISSEIKRAVCYDEYALFCCVEKDYPTRAKKIVSVFDTCIRPELKKLKERENHG